MLAVPLENVPSGVCEQQRPRSDCTSAQSDPGLCCSQTESLDTIESVESKCLDERDDRPVSLF